MNDIKLAAHIAEKFHQGQFYGENPYTFHLQQVVSSVFFSNNKDERLSVIAWLHDVLEDTECTVDILKTLFDEDVVTAVVALTKLPSETREQYLKRLMENPLASNVKLHDAFCNMLESFHRSDMKRVRKYAQTLLTLTS